MNGFGVNRRRFIGLVMAVLAALPGPAWADDSGGHDSGGHDSAGHDGADHNNGGDTAGDNGGNAAASTDGANASDIQRHDHGGDQGAARNAVTNGKAVSLREVLDAVDHSIGGEVVDVKLVNAKSGLRYDLKIIDRRGRLIEVSVDALTKDIQIVRGY